MCNPLLQGVTFYDQPDFLDLENILTGDLIDLGPDIGEQLGDLSNDSFNLDTEYPEIDNQFYNIEALLDSDDSESEITDDQSTCSENTVTSEQTKRVLEDECANRYRLEKYAQYNEIPIKEIKLKEHNVKKIKIEDLLGPESSDVEDLLETEQEEKERSESFAHKKKTCDINRLNEILRSDSPDIEDFLGTKEEDIKEILEFKEDIVQDYEPEIPEPPCNTISKDVEEINIDALLRPKSCDIQTLLETNLDNLIGFDEVFEKPTDESHTIFNAAHNTNLDCLFEFNNTIYGNDVDKFNNEITEKLKIKDNNSYTDKTVVLEENRENSDLDEDGSDECNIISKDVEEINIDSLLRPKSCDIQTLLETNLDNLIGFDEVFEKPTDESHTIFNAAHNTNLDCLFEFNNTIYGNDVDKFNNEITEKLKIKDNNSYTDKTVVLEENRENSGNYEIKTDVKEKRDIKIECFSDDMINTPKSNKISNPTLDSVMRNQKEIKLKIIRNIKNESKENNTNHLENNNFLHKLKSNNKIDKEKKVRKYKKVSPDITNQSTTAKCLKTSLNFMNFLKDLDEDGSDEEDLEDITLEAHPERLYSCTMCKRSFNDAKYFKQHQRLHSRRRHSCTICGMAFAYKSDLKNHIDTHSKDHFVCCICSKIFNQQILLRDHVDFEHTQKPWKCMFCCIYLNKIFILSHKCISKSIKTPAAKRKKLEPRVHRLNEDDPDFLNILDPGDPLSPGEFDCYGVDDEVISLKDVVLFPK